MPAIGCGAQERGLGAIVAQMGSFVSEESLSRMKIAKSDFLENACM